MALNEQAVREVYKWAERNLRDYGGEWELHNELCDMLKAALAKPPRNCDLDTAEEQSDRYEAHCDTYHKTTGKCDDCPVYKEQCKMTGNIPHCQLVWAQMPYQKVETVAEEDKKDEVAEPEIPPPFAPCPKCGKNGARFHHPTYDGGAYVGCSECGYSDQSKT